MPLLFFRWLGGVAVGGTSVVSPVYITEIAPARRRGLLVAVSQLNIVVGILVGLSLELPGGVRAGGGASRRVALDVRRGGRALRRPSSSRPW